MSTVALNAPVQRAPNGRRRRARRRRKQAMRPEPQDQSVPSAPFGVRGTRLQDALRFFRSFLRQPATVGAFMPSSRALAAAMVDRAGVERARTVVELGPGTGAITRSILDRISPSALMLALELDRSHVRELRKRFRRLRVYRDSAEHLQRYLGRYRRKRADVIISGLPWASMSARQQTRILQSVLECLGPDGTFVTFGYTHVQWLPGARRLRQLLTKSFSVIGQSPTIWRNMPPALVYTCRRPLTDS